MTHRLAMMRGDIPIPEIDVTRPALAPKVAAAQVVTNETGDSGLTGSGPVAAAPEFVGGERVMVSPFSAEFYPCIYTHSDELHHVRSLACDWINAGTLWVALDNMIRRPTPDEMRKYWPEDKA